MPSNEGSLRAAIAVTRFGLGARPGEIAKVASDPDGWLAAQSGGAEQPAGQWPDAQNQLAALASYRDQVRALRADLAALASPGASRERQQALQTASRSARQPIDDESVAEILARGQLAATTQAGFRERWTLFWSNHFTVGRKDQAMPALAPTFEREAIRPRVFGRFEDLLVAAITHQAMLHYLDQPHSAGPNSVA